MAIDPGPHDLDATRYLLGPDGGGTLKKVSPNFYEELGQDFPDFSGRILIQRFEFDEPWGTWEVHPKGDEFVYLLSGDVDFTLRTAEGETSVRVNEPGSYVVVPRGTWHTASPRARTAMLFVTPGEGTENRAEPPI